MLHDLTTLRPLSLLTLLLQAAVHPAFLYVTGSMGLVAFVFAVFSFFRKESREDKQAREAAAAAKDAAKDRKIKELEDSLGQFVGRDALEKRFSGIEAKANMLGTELANQHNTLMEFLRERERLFGIISNRLNLLEEKVHVFEVVPGRVDKLESKLDNLHSLYSELKTGQRELRNEMREDMKSNKGEILEAIKSLKL